MPLKQQLQKDLLEAMKAHEEIKVSALRMLKASILKFETAGERKEASNDNVLTIIGKEVKQRRDSIEEFKKGGRMDLAAKEEQELAVLQTYLQAQMSEEEVKKLVAEVISSVGAHSKADTGKVMAVLMPKIRGKADGTMASKMVSALLEDAMKS